MDAVCTRVPAVPVTVLVSSAEDVSQRQVMRRAETVGLLMRHTVNVVVVVIALSDPRSSVQPVGRALLAALGLWAVYRLVTRSHRRVVTAIDFLLVVAVCAEMSQLLQDPGFHSYNTAPQAIAGTAVISFSVSLPIRSSLPLAFMIAGAYAYGGAELVGWGHVADIPALYYFVLQWVTASVIRLMLLRVAEEVDLARSGRHAAELDQQVTEAVREYEREQLALLHDTAASTLLMVGQGAALPPSRLAAQANRDLELLREGPWVAPPLRVELVSALRQVAEHLTTAVIFDVTSQVWLSGDVTKAVVAAAREAMNNVDRHALATRLTITVGPDSVTLRDDGIGFDVQRPRHGRGITDSILGRMQRAGGSAEITSSPGAGTVTRLSWSAGQRTAEAVAPRDPDRLIDRIRLRYGVALTGYSLANLAVSAKYVIGHSAQVGVEVGLFVAAAAATLAALPAILRGRRAVLWPVVITLLIVTVGQSLIIGANDLGGQAHWVQNAIGWCVLPTALALPTRRGRYLLVFYWIVNASVQLVRSPDAETMVNLGLGTASILAVQLFALVFNGLMRDAAQDVQAETEEQQRLRRRERVAQALRAEYQRRYATLVDNVMPLLRTMSDGDAVDEQFQRQARAESRRLRALFDQAATFDNPIMEKLRPLIDAAESRHVEMVVEVAGELPDLHDTDIAGLLVPLALVLAGDMASARLVVTAEPEEVTVSVVCRGITPTSLDLLEIDSAVVDVVCDEDSVWVLVRHRMETQVPLHPAARL